MNVPGAGRDQYQVNLNNERSRVREGDGALQGSMPDGAGLCDAPKKRVDEWKITTPISKDEVKFEFYKTLLDGAFAGEVGSDVLKMISDNIENICKLNISEEKKRELEQIKDKIAVFFQRYLEKKISGLGKDLKKSFCKMRWNSQHVFDKFSSYLDKISSSYSESMKDVLWQIDFARVRANYSLEKIESLIRRLNHHRGTVQDERQLYGLPNECLHTANLIIGKAKKSGDAMYVKPSVIETFLKRVSDIIVSSMPLTVEQVRQCKTALECISKLLGAAPEGRNNSNPEYTAVLLDAILNARFAAYKETHPGKISEKSPEEWTKDDLVKFVGFFSTTHACRTYYSAEFQEELQVLLGKGHRDKPFIRQSDGWISGEEDVDVAPNFGDRLFTKFRKIERLERQVLYDDSGLSEEDRYWGRMIEEIRGKRFVGYYNARRCISMLASMSAAFRSQAIRNFVDTGEGENKIEMRMAALQRAMSTPAYDRVSISQPADENKVKVILWHKGAQVHIVKLPVLSKQGIPIQSIGVELQLLLPGGEAAMKEFYRDIGYGQETLKYYRPGGELGFI